MGGLCLPIVCLEINIELCYMFKWKGCASISFLLVLNSFHAQSDRAQVIPCFPSQPQAAASLSSAFWTSIPSNAAERLEKNIEINWEVIVLINTSDICSLRDPVTRGPLLIGFWNRVSVRS